MNKLDYAKIIKISTCSFYLLLGNFEKVETITDEEKLKAIKEVISKSFKDEKISDEDMQEILRQVNSSLYQEGIARYFESLEH